MKVGLILETGEAREVHHMCALLGYGADAICPYLVFHLARNLKLEGALDCNVLDEEYFSVGNHVITNFSEQFHLSQQYQQFNNSAVVELLSGN